MTGADPLAIDGFADAAPAKPLWLVTLADLALLLVGFFVLLQASQTADRQAIAQALRATFGGGQGDGTSAPMPVAATAIEGFLPGSSIVVSDPAPLIAWARDASRDPRTMLVVTGGVDGSAQDTDRITGSGALLAADRARAVAAILASALPGTRLAVSAEDVDRPRRRAVTISLAFAGDRQSGASVRRQNRRQAVAGRQPAAGQ